VAARIPLERHAVLKRPFTELPEWPLHNAAREALIKASANSAELFLAEVAHEGIEAVMAEHCDALGASRRWDHGEDGVLVDAVFEAYRHWCDVSGSKAFKKEGLGQHIRLAFASADRHRITADGVRSWAYRGLPRKGRS